MNYVIDTHRDETWREADPEAVLVAENDLDTVCLKNDDTVFAHTPTDFELDLTHDQKELGMPVHLEPGLSEQQMAIEKLRKTRIRKFRQAMINAAIEGRAPKLVLFSGDCVDDVRERGWRKDLIVGLPGFPAENTVICSKPFSRTISSEYLRRDLLEPSSVGLPSRLEELCESDLAMQLLCEAWTLTGGRGEGVAGGITICAPLTATDWFSPFSLQPSEEAAGNLVNLMTEGKEEALALLVAVTRGKEDISLEVRAVLQALRPKSSVEEKTIVIEGGRR